MNDLSKDGDLGGPAESAGVSDARAPSPHPGLIFGRAGSSSRVGVAWILLLFFLGILHFSYFYNRGLDGRVEIGFENYDWHKEYRYYSIWSQALRDGEMPYHASSLIQRTRRFLAIPETVQSPQILLLKWLEIETFIYVNTLILYGVGFLGLVALKRRYSLSLFAFTVLWLFYNFNGHIVGHLSVGHSMWNGYFLLAWYFYFFLDWPKREPRELFWSPVLWLSLVLFFIFLQGSFHVFLWCLLLLLLYLLFNRDYWKPVAAVWTTSILLCAVRILPAAITYWSDERTFVTGYPNLMAMLWGLVTVQEPSRLVSVMGVQDVGWWEYNIFVGYAGLGFLVWFGMVEAWRMRRSRPELRYSRLDWPLLVMALLSVNGLFYFFAGNHIPLLSGERVPSRFLIMPVLALFILGGARLQALLDAHGHRFLCRWVAVVLLVYAWLSLWMHLVWWKVDPVDLHVFKPNVDWSIHLIELSDPAYVTWWWIALGISLITLVGAVTLLVQERRAHKKKEAAP